MIYSNEYENLVRFDSDVLYTFIDGKEQIITESDLGKLIGCEFYSELSELPMHYQIDNVWDTLAREPSCKKVASNLKYLPLRFLRHFIASTVQCRTRSFAKLTTDDIWLLEMASKGTKINLSQFIMNKMLKVLKEKEKEAQSKRKKMSQSQFEIPYVTLITHYAKSLGIVQPKYEMIQIAVTYNLASIAKMGYKDKDNNGDRKSVV